jgi:hypothetical protein
VITIEIVTVKHRTLVASVFNTGWKLGFGILALMGYFIRDWPKLQVRRDPILPSSKLIVIGVS